MTTALRRKLASLRALAERPGTPGEGDAARAAIGRVLERLGDNGEEEGPMSPYVPFYMIGGLLLWGFAFSYSSMLGDWLARRRKKD
jgi:hypothetical protein